MVGGIASSTGDSFMMMISDILIYMIIILMVRFFLPSNTFQFELWGAMKPRAHHRPHPEGEEQLDVKKVCDGVSRAQFE